MLKIQCNLYDRYGNVFSFGAGMFGQLGLLEKNGKEPLLCAFVPTVVNKRHFGDEAVVQVACGEVHSVALTESGVLYTFGFQVTLGRGDNATKDNGEIILPVSGLPLGGIVQVSCNGFCTVVRTVENFVYVWGDLGLHDEIPNIPKPYKLHHADGSSFLAESVAASDHFVVLADLMGNVYCYNEDGNFRPVLELPGRRVSMLSCCKFAWVALLQ